MTHVTYDELISHAGHTLEMCDYGESANLYCRTCNTLIKLFMREEIWTIEQGQDFTAYGKVLYTKLNLSARLELPWDIINLHNRGDINPGDWVCILKCEVPEFKNRVGKAKSHYFGTHQWYVEVGGNTVMATVRLISTKAQRAAAVQMMEALKELLNHCHYDQMSARLPIREAYLAIAAAYGIKVEQTES